MSYHYCSYGHFFSTAAWLKLWRIEWHGKVKWLSSTSLISWTIGSDRYWEIVDGIKLSFNLHYFTFSLICINSSNHQSVWYLIQLVLILSWTVTVAVYLGDVVWFPHIMYNVCHHISRWTIITAQPLHGVILVGDQYWQSSWLLLRLDYYSGGKTNMTT